MSYPKKTEGIILRSRHFRNTSLILTFYTKDRGKIEALAKGIKNRISKGEGGMEVFSQVEIIYYERGHILRLLSHSYLLNSFRFLRMSPLKFTCATYLVELVDILVHGEEKNENIYNLLLNSLYFMKEEKDLDGFILFFEIKLINYLGYGLSSTSGFISPRILSLFQFLEKAELNTYSRLKMSRDDKRELQGILQNHIQGLLGNKTLRSRRIIEEIKKD